MLKDCRQKLKPILQAFFGARRTECEYAKIFFEGSSRRPSGESQDAPERVKADRELKKARVRFSQLMSEGRALDGVLRRLRKTIAITWYDDELDRSDELSLDELLEAVNRQEEIRSNQFVNTFEKVADSIVVLCKTSAAKRERDIKMLKFLWDSEHLLLSRSSRISFGKMDRISFAIERAAKATVAVFPVLDEYVRRVRSAALAKMGPSWSRAIEQFDTAAVNGMDKSVARRREVFDLYARLLGRSIEPRIREMFCGQKSVSRVSKSR